MHSAHAQRVMAMCSQYWGLLISAEKNKIEKLYIRSSAIKRKTFSIGSTGCSKGLYKSIAPYLLVWIGILSVIVQKLIQT